MRDLTVILPAHNEENTIGQVIDEVRIHVDCDILVADSSSTDGTYYIAFEKADHVVALKSKGKGFAMRKAFDLVKSPYIVMMDSDCTYPAVYIPEIYRLLKLGADVVMGYRKWRSPHSMPFANQVGNKVLSLLASLLYKRVRDVCTGMWGFRKEALDKFYLSSDGFTLEVDLFVNTVKQDCDWGELPISYRARPDGSETKLKLSDGVKIARHLIKAKWTR